LRDTKSRIFALRARLHAVKSVKGNLYADPHAALKAVHQDYLYWTGKLTESSFQMSVALIGANWAVFGSLDRVLENVWSQVSIAVTIVGLGASLIGTMLMGEMHRFRVQYAEENPDRWSEEFKDTAGKIDPWPFTSAIEKLGSIIRWIRWLSPVIGGAFFIGALVFHGTAAAEWAVIYLSRMQS